MNSSEQLNLDSHQSSRVILRLTDIEKLINEFASLPKVLLTKNMDLLQLQHEVFDVWNSIIPKLKR